jgi:hypothetical protein
LNWWPCPGYNVHVDGWAWNSVLCSVPRLGRWYYNSIVYLPDKEWMNDLSVSFVYIYIYTIPFW